MEQVAGNLGVSTDSKEVSSAQTEPVGVLIARTFGTLALANGGRRKRHVAKVSARRRRTCGCGLGALGY